MAPSMNTFGEWMADIMKRSPTNFRLMGPDETESNKLSAVYAVTKKVWMGGYLPEDED
ncbi:hypothetical protein LTR12_018632, partial [Friedmanniomyces endolithicus]